MENKKLLTVYIAYGSNMGEWLKIQKKVFPLIELRIGTVLQKSKTYISPAWGKIDQPDFKNGVIQAETALNSFIERMALFPLGNNARGGLVKTVQENLLLDGDQIISAHFTTQGSLDKHDFPGSVG